MEVLLDHYAVQLKLILHCRLIDWNLNKNLKNKLKINSRKKNWYNSSSAKRMVKVTSVDEILAGRWKADGRSCLLGPAEGVLPGGKPLHL